jgi:hypothetical protein
MLRATQLALGFCEQARFGEDFPPVTGIVVTSPVVKTPSAEVVMVMVQGLQGGSRSRRARCL